MHLAFFGNKLNAFSLELTINLTACKFYLQTSDYSATVVTVTLLEFGDVAVKGCWNMGKYTNSCKMPFFQTYAVRKKFAMGQRNPESRGNSFAFVKPAWFCFIFIRFWSVRRGRWHSGLHSRTMLFTINAQT